MSILNSRKRMVQLAYMIGFGLFLIMYWFNNASIPVGNVSNLIKLRSLFSTDYGYFNSPIFAILFSNFFIGYEFVNHKYDYTEFYRSSRVKMMHIFEKHLFYDSLMFGGIYLLVGIVFNELLIGKMILNGPFNFLLAITFLTTIIFLLITGLIFRLIISLAPNHIALIIDVCFNGVLYLIASRFHIWHPMNEINFFSDFFRNQLTVIDVSASLCRLILLFVGTRAVTHFFVYREDVL